MIRVLALLAPLVALGVGVAYAASLGVGSQQLAASVHTVQHAQCVLGSDAVSDDAFVHEDNGDRNFGSASTLDVRPAPGNVRYSFIRFDLASCGIPPGAGVDAATLRLVIVRTPRSSRTYKLVRVTSSWSGSSISWNNQPSVAGSSTAAFATGTTNGATIAVPVTADVDAFVSGAEPNYGWQIKDPGAGPAFGRFASAENGDAAIRPQLVVSYSS